MPIAPIETSYSGCRFRSRTEARWAVAFTHLGIAWEHEPDGYRLASGTYLPDFWLPEVRQWIEVKPIVHMTVDPRWQELADLTGFALRVLYGMPGPEHEQQTFRPGRPPSARRQLPAARRTEATLAAWRAARSARFGT